MRRTLSVVVVGGFAADFVEAVNVIVAVVVQFLLFSVTKGELAHELCKGCC